MPDHSRAPVVDAGLVALGGAAGSLARWGLEEGVPGPWGTLAANVSGCFLIGLLAAWLFVRHSRLRLLLGVGLLGGYTTFSTHLLDAHDLIGEPLGAAAYVGGSLVGCLLAAAVGLVLGRRLPGATT